MIKKLLLSIGVLFCCIGFAHSQSTIKGIVKDTDGNPLIQVQVSLYQEGVIERVGQTDKNGEYQLLNLQPGIYDVEARTKDGKGYKVEAIRLSSGDLKNIDFDIDVANVQALTVVSIKYKKDIVDPNQLMQSTEIDGENLRKQPGRDVSKALASADGVSSIDGSIMSVRGNRSDGQVVIIDGVRVRGSSSVAMQAMDGAQLIQGGIPAEYGDGTSFQVYNTRGVPKSFSTNVELRGSIDGYNNFLGAVSVSGPITKPDNFQKGRIGFMLSGEGYFNQDSRPLRGGYWVAKDEVIKDITENPLRYSTTDIGANATEASYLLEDAFEKKRVKTNAGNWGFIVQGKLDFQPIKSEDIVKANSLRISLNGSYDYGKGKDWSRSMALFNSGNVSVYDNSTMRLFARLNHQVISTDSGFLKSLTYDLNVSYTRYKYSSYDPIKKFDAFKYGHIGNFKTYKQHTYQYYSDGYTTEDGITWYDGVYVMTSRLADSLVTFTPGEHNPDLAQYNLNMMENFTPEVLSSLYGIPYDKTAYQQFGGLLNGGSPSAVYGMYYLPGATSSGYSKSESSTWGAKASLTMNLGNHELKLGFELDRPSYRGYSINANSLWTLMRQHTNSHIQELDKTQYVYENGRISFPTLIDLGSQSAFDRNLRENLGYDPNGEDWIDVDNLDPETFDVSMFSAEELLVGTTGTGSMVSYYGYDYTGKKHKKKTDIDDFFNGKDENGRRTYNVGAYEPIYMAMYLQDKFSIRTLVFNVGVRIDRFDANQSVLKDPYLFRPAHTVSSIADSWTNLSSTEIEKKRSSTFVSNAGDDWVVYVNQKDGTLDLDNTSIIGYRDGNTWYDASGQEVTDVTALLGANGGPILLDAIDKSLISKVDSKAFMDYETQWSVMPRLSFSFPVSNKSRFTAHYNIVTSRPTNLQLDPVSYLFIEKYGSSQSNVVSNPNLKSQKSIDYEIGFAQALGENAAVNISAYYSEKRDMIQTYRYTGAYPSTYYSYSNIDFGTVQGFSLSYMMREMKNVTLRAGYTIQFAKGTGSSAASNLAIIQSGQPNLRTLTNLSFDQRHRFNVNLSYTLGTGTNYIGPRSEKQLTDTTKKEIRWFENMTFSLIFSAASGLPYSKSSIPYSGIGQGGSSRLSGTINGSHRPWTYQCDLRVDRTFTLQGKEKDGKKGKTSYMTVYVDVTNLFNFKNILSVYEYTGNADDDGYLTATEYQQQINSQTSVDSYKWYYEMTVKNPYNYSAPTRVSLGFMFLF